MAVIEVKNLSKQFLLGKKNTDNHSLTLRDKIAGMLDFSDQPKQYFFALSDLCFQVEKGEVLGLIGSNGSGKSTLLKILSGIIRPTDGFVRIIGRVASLLDVGTGFHPELTGRENIYMNSAMHKMPKRLINERFNEIVEYAGVKDFLDMPVKRYSSGMYVRLAFAVAAHVESDILLIDEVLSVGDQNFQRKCLGTVDRFVSDRQRTIIIVSHNLEMVRSICNRVIWLENGQIKDIGPANQVIADYLKSINTKKEVEFDQVNASGTESMKAKSIRAVFPNGKDSADINDQIRVICDFACIAPIKNINLSLVLYYAGHCVLNSISPVANLEIGEYRFICTIPGGLLNSGLYSAKFIVSKDFMWLFSVDGECMFELSDHRDIDWHGEWIGAVRPKLPWEIRKMENDLPESK